MGQHHGGQMGSRVYRGDCLPRPVSGGALAVDLNDGDEFSYGCAREMICRRGGSYSCVLATVCKGHRHQVGRVQGSSSRSW